MSLRPGIVGLGQVAWRFDEEPGRKTVWTHAGAYREAGYETVVAYDPDSAARAAFARRFPGAIVVDSVEKFVDTTPDVVSICSPNVCHAETLHAILPGAPRAIWCEKPLATDLADARTMVEACAVRDIPLVVSHVRRWSPSWGRFKTRLDSGEIGPVRSLRVAMPNRLWSIGSHAVDALLWLGGQVSDMRHIAIPALEEGGEPGVAGIFMFASGAIGYLQVTGWKANLITEVEAIGDTGRLSMSEAEGVVRHEAFDSSELFDGYNELGAARIEDPTEPAGHSPFTAIAREIQGLVDGTVARPTCSGGDALRVHEILDRFAAAAPPVTIAKAAE